MYRSVSVRSLESRTSETRLSDRDTKENDNLDEMRLQQTTTTTAAAAADDDQIHDFNFYDEDDDKQEGNNPHSLRAKELFPNSNSVTGNLRGSAAISLPATSMSVDSLAVAKQSEKIQTNNNGN